MLTGTHTLLVEGYGDSKCKKMLNAPWGYDPGTAQQFEAGKLTSNTEVYVNDLQFRPNPGAVVIGRPSQPMKEPLLLHCA